MRLQPPRFLYAVLSASLSHDASGPTILGDLHEEFMEKASEQGVWHARAWYTFEAMSLASTSVARNILRSLGGRERRERGERRVDNNWSLRSLINDARYAFKAVRRDVTFFVFASLIVGIGVGASTSVYSVMSPLLFAPLPFENPQELVWIANGDPGDEKVSLSWVTHRTNKLRDMREMTQLFDGMAAFNAFFNQSTYSLVGDGRAEQLMGAEVSDDFLDVLGVQLAAGRNFTSEEGSWGGPQAVILTHGFWMRRFAGDPRIVGSTIRLDDSPREVVGVLPSSFDFSSVFFPSVPVDFILPFPIGDETNRWGNTISIVARMRPGTTIDAVRAEYEEMNRALAEADPERWGLGGHVAPLQGYIAGPFKSALFLLAGAAGAVMLIVCVNLSNMLLARSPKRTREIAVRRTMGATRFRLVRQLMIESVALAASGAVVGVAIAVVATRLVSNSSGVTIPMLNEVAVDGAALGFTLLLALIAGLLVGIIPALQVSDGGEAAAMKTATGASRSGKGAGRLRELLVVSEVALACVLLVFGGLFLRSFQQVLDVQLGFTPENAVAWQLNPSADMGSLAEMTAAFGQMTAAVAVVPGVASVGLIDALPLGRNRTWGFRVVGRVVSETEQGYGLFPHMIDPGYLETMRIPLVAGRAFTADDVEGTTRVVLINESGAREVFPDGDAIGQQISVSGDILWTVIGVVGDVKHRTLEGGSGTQIYFPFAQLWSYSTLDMVVRSNIPIESIVGPVSAALTRVDGAMPTDDFWTIESTVDQAVSSRRFTLSLLGVFAATALLLAALGIYGVLSYSVAERLPEIGIRMALGASGAHVRGQVVGRTLFLASIGIVIGMTMAIVGSGVVSSMLFGVAPTDPVTLLGMVVILLSVAGFAGFIPARRAARTDLLTVLRG
jgi:putative ABC transport system permease protein